jgi:CBS domain-containing protein
MRVEQLMTKEVRTCRPDESLSDAARVLWERDCGFAPVIDGDGAPRLVGVLTDRDICMAAFLTGRRLSEIPVCDVMSRTLRTCRADDAVADAEATMRSAQVHRLPVVDGAGQLLGVISLADLAREAIREKGAAHREVTETEIGCTVAAIHQPR